jgi:hypothetical protein
MAAALGRAGRPREEGSDRRRHRADFVKVGVRARRAGLGAGAPDRPAPGPPGAPRHRGHARMMAAGRPSPAGPDSKSIDLPAHAAVREIRDAHVEGRWPGPESPAILPRRPQGAAGL